MNRRIWLFMVTMKDIAVQAGVSQPTVSRVLNGKGTAARISVTTQKRIQAIAKKLHFRPSFAGRALVRGKTRSIGFMCGNIRNPFYTELADIAMQMVEEQGYHLIMGVSRWFSWQNDLECFDGLLSRGVDGVIYFGSALAPGRTQYERVIRDHFPIVSINHQAPGISCIQFDAQGAMDEAFALLKANGHRRVMGLRMGGIGKHVPFLTAAKKYDFDVEMEDGPRVHSDILTPREQLLQKMRQEAYRFAARKDRPGAVFVSSDHLAMPFITGLWDKGLMVPRDVSVIGFDGTRAGENLAPPLTSIGQDMTGTIQRALEIIFDGIEQEKTSPRNVVLPARLVVRDSIGANNKV
jgi:LacI family transcriptional regulator